MTTQAGASGYSESFAAVRTLGDVLGTVDVFAGRLATEHEKQLGIVAAQHEIAFQQEDRGPGTHSVPELLEATEQAVTQTVLNDGREVLNLMAHASTVIPPMLGPLESKLLTQTVQNADAYIKEPAGVEGIVAFASGMESRAAMRLVAYRAIMATATVADVKLGETVLQSWIRASSGNTARALKAGLDAYTYAAARQQAAPRISGNGELEQTLRRASTPNAGMAMNAALDVELLASSGTRAMYDRVVGTIKAPKTYRPASSPTVERVLLRHFRPIAKLLKDGTESQTESRSASGAASPDAPIRILSQRLDA